MQKLSKSRGFFLNKVLVLVIIGGISLMSMLRDQVVFAEEPGAYHIQIYGSYLNPDTGKTEDGGTQNAGIGEGMVDGVVTPDNPEAGIDSVMGKAAAGEEKYAVALLEKLKSGERYATVRLYLMNFIRFSEADGPFIKVRQEDGSYQEVEYDITKQKSEEGEKGVNYMDFRFEVPEASFSANVEMFVMPMSRPVKYFIIGDETQLKTYDFEQQNDENSFEAAMVKYEKSQSASKNLYLYVGIGVAIMICLIVIVISIKKKKGAK